MEDYPCESKEQLLKREGELQRIHKEHICNLYIAGNSKNRKERDARYYRKNKEKCLLRSQQYAEKNPEKRKATLQQYYQKNRERILQRGTEQVQCECGSSVRSRNLTKHKKTQKHINFINGL